MRRLRACTRCGEAVRPQCPDPVVLPGSPLGTAVTKPVETTQIAPTILQLLGLDPNELMAA
jgi:hypothetical protein